MKHHFSEFFFPVLKREVDEILRKKKVKKILLKDFKVFIVFDKNISLKISLHPDLYYFYPFKGKVGCEKELPYLKDFSYQGSDIIEGERIFFIDFVKKNPLGEVKKRKGIIDFTRRGRDFLIMEDNKVLFSFRKRKEFKPLFPEKINIFRTHNSDKLIEYIEKYIPFLYEFVKEKNMDFLNLKNEFEEIYKGPFYVDENLNLHLIRKEKFLEFKRLYEALMFIYEKIEQKIEEEKLKKKKSKKKKEKKVPEIDPEIYRIKGEVILVNLEKLKGKKGKFKLLHPEYGEVEIEIKKDETPSKAAERYFGRYKRLKRGKEIKEKIKKEDRKMPYRVFISPSGFKVLVSKNKEFANELTFKIAGPDDYFFHVKDAPGAHVILKKGKNEKVSEEDIIFASKIAKEFSKLKNEKKVKVIYTLRKYVKPVKGEKGLVRIKRENIIVI